MAQVDFMPATIGEVEDHGGYLSIIFPMQPLIAEQIHAESVVPFNRCELRIKGGRLVATVPPIMPMHIENLWVQHQRDGQGCHLPVGFKAEGPITLRVEVLRGSDYVREDLATGDEISFHLFEEVLPNEP